MRAMRATKAALGAAVLTGILWATAPLAVAGGGCMHGTPPTDGTGTTVEMVANCFTPTVMHAKSGATITFVNRDDYAHTVTGVGGLWGTFDELSPGSKVAYTFDEDGVYLYVCFIHPGMVGAVVVGDGRGDAGLNPASVEAADLPADPPVAAPAPVTPSAGGIGPGVTLALVGVLAALMGLGTFAIARGRRAPVST